MELTRRKMNKIAGELFSFLATVGADNIKLQLKREVDHYELAIHSNFDPALRAKIERLETLMHPSNRYEGLEDFYWELAGDGNEWQDSELQLVAQMVDSAQFVIHDSDVFIQLQKAL